jgi:hypothetical protein
MQYIVGMITSVELNRVRSIKTLDEFKKPLVEFLALDRASAMAVYEHEGWGEEDLDADIESVHELLDKIEHRVKSLGHYVMPTIKFTTVNHRRYDGKGRFPRNFGTSLTRVSFGGT